MRRCVGEENDRGNGNEKGVHTVNYICVDADARAGAETWQGGVSREWTYVAKHACPLPFPVRRTCTKKKKYMTVNILRIAQVRAHV